MTITWQHRDEHCRWARSDSSRRLLLLLCDEAGVAGTLSLSQSRSPWRQGPRCLRESSLQVLWVWWGAGGWLGVQGCCIAGTWGWCRCGWALVGVGMFGMRRTGCPCPGAAGGGTGSPPPSWAEKRGHRHKTLRCHCWPDCSLQEEGEEEEEEREEGGHHPLDYRMGGHHHHSLHRPQGETTLQRCLPGGEGHRLHC